MPEVFSMFLLLLNTYKHHQARVAKAYSVPLLVKEQYGCQLFLGIRYLAREPVVATLTEEPSNFNTQHCPSTSLTRLWLQQAFSS